MTKSEILEILQIVGTFLVLWSGKYLNKAKKVMDEFDSMKEKMTTLENSQKAVWKVLDVIKVKKDIPHGGEI